MRVDNKARGFNFASEHLAVRQKANVDVKTAIAVDRANGKQRMGVIVCNPSVRTAKTRKRRLQFILAVCSQEKVHALPRYRCSRCSQFCVSH